LSGDSVRNVEKTRILMVDDHPIVREGMALFLNAQTDLHLCCEAGNTEEAMASLAQCHPALAIVDIALHGESGLDLIKLMRRRCPDLAILAMSLHEESIFAERALRAGANGYLMKHEATANILLAVRLVLSGGIYLSEAMHRRLAQKLATPGGSPDSAIAGLSGREFEILHLLGLGFGTRQISEKLNRSIKTIEAHRAGLKEKLQLKSGADLVRFASKWLDER
jgi:two-component system, NarL family, response regulator FusR